MLDLAENNFHGNIFKNNSSLSFTSSFIVNGNQLTGDIPSNICNMFNLVILDISKNQLSGKLPSCMKNLDSIGAFHAGGNSLGGSIPSEFCRF